MILFFYGWRRNFEAWKIWRQMKKEAKNTVGGGRKNWVFSNLIVSCIYLMQLEGVCESWILNVWNVQHWEGKILLNTPRYTYSKRSDWEGISQRILPFSRLPSTTRLDLCLDTITLKVGRNMSIFKDWALNQRTCCSGPVTVAATLLVLATACAAMSTDSIENKHICQWCFLTATGRNVAEDFPLQPTEPLILTELHVHGLTPIYEMRLILSQGEQVNLEMAMKESVWWVKI